MAPSSYSISASISNASTPAYASKSSNGKDTGGSDFAALLSGTNANKNARANDPTANPAAAQAPAPTSTSTQPTSGSNDFDVAEQDEDVEVIEPAAEAVPTPPAIDTTQVVALTDAILQLRESLAAGNPVDPELLAQINNSLDELAKQLGLDLGSLNTSDDLNSLLNGVASNDTSSKGLFASLLRSLEGVTTPDKLAQQPAATDEALADINEKLAKLLTAIDGGDVDEGKLASLGLAADKPRPNDIEQSLLRLAAAVTDKPTGPVLSSPSLKMSDQLLATESETSQDSATDPKLASLSSAAGDASGSETNTDTSDDKSAHIGEDRRPVTMSAAPTFAEIMPATTQSVDAPATALAEMRVEATAVRTIPLSYMSSQQQLNIPAIAFEMSRQMEGGVSRFQIRLDPPELGRIDVRLDVDQNGQLNAKLIVEKPETLDMMQRDQRALEKALQQAGIDAHRSTLEFSLKQNDQQAHRDGSRFERAEALLDSDDTTNEPTPQVTLYRGNLQASGLNILA